MNFSLVSRLCLPTLALATAAHAEILSQRDVVELTSTADAIVVAGLAPQTRVAPRGTVNLTIERALKGPLKPGQSVVAAYEYSHTRPGGQFSFAGSTAVFFLAGREASWTLLSVTKGSLFDFTQTFFALPPASAPVTIPPRFAPVLLDLVVAELFASFDVAQLPLPSLVGIYRTHRTPALKYLYEAHRDSRNQAVRRIVNRILTLEDANAMAQLPRTFATMPRGDADALAHEIRFYLNDSTPAMVAALGHIALSDAPYTLRLAAATALARAHTREALPYLARLLDSTEAGLPSCALLGLASFANNVPPGSRSAPPARGDWKYRSDDTFRNAASDPLSLSRKPATIPFWKDWWARHRADILAGK